MSNELQTTTKSKAIENIALKNLKWPTSKPGPWATQPPPGQKPLPTRTDQVVEIGYDQEGGEPSSQSYTRSLPDVSLKDAVSPDLAKNIP